MEYAHVTHTFGPVFDENSKILILGSFPSVKSREINFYYGHPQNRFWKVLAGIYGQQLWQTTGQKRAFLLEHKIALWDVIASCVIEGSQDSSIKAVKANDLGAVLGGAPIEKILLNGGKAYELFLKYCQKEGMPPAVKMPSTSPANAAFRLERLIEVWSGELTV